MSHPLSTFAFVTFLDTPATLFNQPMGSPTELVSGRARIATASATSPSPFARARQRSLDDLGVPLSEVTFCVFDVETTGGNRQLDEVTEIGAVKLRGGECIGTFQTMVNPGIAIPAEITMLTGISQAMVIRAPKFDQILPSFLEFVGDAVIVGHNVSFDMAFLQRACEAKYQQRLTNQVVDTLAIARRLIVDEVPNLKLGTLADRLRLDHRPSHRALDDALATGDLLHMLLERAAAYGVMGLDDLIALPKMDAHPQASKIKLTDGLPRTRGVYLFHDRDGRVLYVGKATNLRSRVRSYFSGDQRRKVAQLLREVDHLSHLECPGPLEADVTELRLIRQHKPRFNRVGTSRVAPVFVKVTLGEPFPRLSIVANRRDDGAHYVGPIATRRHAKDVVEAIHSVTKIRRCTAPPKSRADCGPCATAQLGASACPCTGFTPSHVYDQIVSTVVVELSERPDRMFDRLRDRMNALALEERFEEAADTRDRAAALATALRRQRTVERLTRAETIEVELPGVGGAELRNGRLVRSWTVDGSAPLFSNLATTETSEQARAADDELRCVASWLDQHADQLRLHHVGGELSSPLPRLPDFAPVASSLAGSGRTR